VVPLWHTPPPVLATYVHRIDPIIVSIGGLHVWWYGLGFALGFWHMHRFIQRHRASLRLDARDAFALSLLVIAGVLIGGRTLEILFDEWPFYRDHPTFIPRYWLGGMATHGLLIGAAAGCGLFCSIYRRSFLRVADALVIPGAFLMGLGRLGNFVDGQIVGGVTDVWWAVKFPDADGFRHPVVLYDGIKNLLLVPYLLRVRATNPTPGATAARFVFWYAALRIVLDLFRDYPTHRLALGTGQTLNLVMAALGLLLLLRSRWRRLGRLRHSAVAEDTVRTSPLAALWWQPVLLAAILVFCLFIPSNWTQNVPDRYGARHPGLHHSWMYPDIDTAARKP
jgi:phosphatidylglycerol---prolipoprotein diacylglyceryl transferase